MTHSDYSETRFLLFDYGGTLDTGGRHWASVLWQSYVNHRVAISKTDFDEAYVWAERWMGSHPVVNSSDDFLLTLQKKTALQAERLASRGLLQCSAALPASSIARECYSIARANTSAAAAVLAKLSASYSLTLVTNFYGNIRAVLRDFGLLPLFTHVVESAAVGLRKPDPAIWKAALELNDASPAACVAVGDSLRNDIHPALSLGCRALWLCPPAAAEEATASAPCPVVTSLDQIPLLLNP